MSDAKKLSEADLQWMQEWADEWASTDLPGMNETQMARLALSALAEIREHRAAAQRHVAFANMVDAARESDLILRHEFWPDIEIARRGVLHRPAPSLTPEDVEALRAARDVASDSDVLEWDGIDERDAALAALDRLLGNGGGR